MTLITVNAQQKVIPLYDALHPIPKAGTGMKRKMIIIVGRMHLQKKNI
jgi:hypothetical protein